MNRFLKKVLCVPCVIGIILSSFSIFASASWQQDIDNEIENEALNINNTYSNYIKDFANIQSEGKEIVIKSVDYTAAAPNSAIVKAENYQGCDNVTVWGNSPDWAEWDFETENDGLYEIEIVYFPLKKTQRHIEAAIKLDGEFPFSEASSMLLKGAYKSEHPIRQDELGNDYNSSQVEIKKWYNESLCNEEGTQSNPYRFFLKSGSHKLALYLLQETFALTEIRLIPVKEAITYEEYKSLYANGVSDTGYSKIYEAECYDSKSTSSIIPASNKNNAHNSPFSYSKQKLNTISGVSWNKSGQWLEYKINAPKSGWYSLNFRYSQSYNKNMPVYRRLYIDGEVPFREADCFVFDYEENWALSAIKTADGEEALIWLDQGEHYIRLEAVMGEIQDIVSSINNIVYELSTIYQKINMITGASPDQYRDYNLKTNIPDMMEVFADSSKTLKEIDKKIKNISGGKGSSSGIISVLAYQLDDMLAAPSTIPMRLSAFSSNISGLSSAGEELKSQAMDLDYILITSPDFKKPRVKDNLFEAFKREVMTFIYSFFVDYNTFTAEDERAITVWANTGRDQAQVIIRMIDDMFVPEYNIKVNFKLVTASLIQAFLAGDPPDAMIMVDRGQPVNLAMRGALADLSKLSDFSTVADEFQKDALIPYMFNDGCYGIPDSQSYFMMFYRKDILKQLGLEIPQTWDELFEVMRIIHTNNMDVGLPYSGIDASAAVSSGVSSTSIFSALLLQNGGSYYNEENTKTALTTPQATKAFTQWTKYYTEYGLPLSYSFFNRFRTGTMPIGIANYTTYNQIYVAAPEIRNLWGMTQIPGTLKENGEISRVQAASGTASIITSTSKNKEAAWEFLRWWTGSEAQTRYSTDIESNLGMAARYPTANVSAFENIQWSRAEFNELSKQWKQVTETPEIPGSYYTVREVDNAFRSVVLNGKSPKEVLIQYSRSIDAEIARKRGEFFLDSQ